MRVLVYEWASAGGVVQGVRRIDVPASLAAEGWAMLSAVAADLANDDRRRVEVHALLEAGRSFPPFEAPVVIHRAGGSADPWKTFVELAAGVDYALVIAPELDGCLARCVTAVVAAGGRLLGPSPEFVRLASDKQATCERLSAAGVPVPRGRLVGREEPWPAEVSVPAVLKPIDGAGSTDIQLLNEPRLPCWPERNVPYRLEQFVAGMPASVAALCGPAGWVLLPACRQSLSDAHRLTYRGGSCPVADELAGRAGRLAARVLAALPPATGYVGMDLVLGHASDGSADAVIEVNPRLTTSYVGLRALLHDNLAAAMLDAVEGRLPALRVRPSAVEFDAVGHVDIRSRGALAGPGHWRRESQGG